MPSAPFLQDARVTPQGTTPSISAPTAQDQSNRQVMALGGAIQQAGTVGAKIYEQELKEANALKVEEALSRAKQVQNDLTFDEQYGYSFQRGDQTFDRESGLSLEEEYGKDFDGELKNIEDKLSNSAQREAFARNAMRMSSGFRGQIQKHEAKEYETWAVSVKQGVIDTLKRDISLNYNDPEKTEHAINGIRGAMRDLLKFSGKEQGNFLDAAVRSQVSEAHMLAVSAMLEDGNASAAETYLNKHREDITANDLFKADVSIGREQDVQITTEAGNDYVRQLIGDGGPVTGAPEELMQPFAGAFRLSGKYGETRTRSNGTKYAHGGIDIPKPSGTPISATGGGRISRINYSKSYGYVVYVDHDDGKTQTRYAHMQKGSFPKGLKKGDRVKRGEVIGKVGSTGRSSGPHLHYEVRVNGKSVDPTGKRSVPRGGTSGGGKGLADVLLSMLGDPRLAGHPDRLREVERRVRSTHGAIKQQEAQNEQDARDAAFEALLRNGGQYDKLPSSVRAAVKGSDLPGILSFSGSVQKALQGPAPRSGSPLWAYTKSDIAEGKVSNVSELNSMRPYLSDADYKNLVGDIVGMTKGDTGRIDSIKTANAAIKYIDTELAAIGIDTTPSGKDAKQQAEVLGKFKGKFYQQISAAERAKGNALTGDEARKIGLSMIAETSKQTDGGGWAKWLIGPGATAGGRAKRGFELNRPAIPYSAIPATVRNRLSKELRDGGFNPTPKRIRAAYIAEQGL